MLGAAPKLILNEYPGNPGQPCRAVATRAPNPSTGNAAGKAGRVQRNQESNPRSELEKGTQPVLVPSRGGINVLGDVVVSYRAGREENAAGI